MVLKKAFNYLVQMHSRKAEIKRPGSPDLYTPIKLMPSNFFRFVAAPSATVIHGREFVIPIDSMRGDLTQLISFDTSPSEGSFHFKYANFETDSVEAGDDESDVQEALRSIPGFLNITVSGDWDIGFTAVLTGVRNPSLLLAIQDNTPLDANVSIAESGGVQWTPIIKRADKIIDPVYGSMAIVEIMEMVDIGGEIMGFRVRSE